MGSSLYNGIKNRDVISTSGTRQMGIETMPPLITRGVLIDVAELDETLAAQKSEVRPGDPVPLRTGWGRLWKIPENFLFGEPGLGKACAKWAVEHEIVCWGCDQFATDPIPFETEGEVLPMHPEMLTKAGIRLVEKSIWRRSRDRKYTSFVFSRLH